MEGSSRRRGLPSTVRGLRPSGYDGEKSLGEECKRSEVSIQSVFVTILNVIKVKKRLKTLEKCVIMIFRDVIKFLAPCTKARGQRPKGGNKHEQV